MHATKNDYTCCRADVTPSDALALPFGMNRGAGACPRRERSSGSKLDMNAAPPLPPTCQICGAKNVTTVFDSYLARFSGSQSNSRISSLCVCARVPFVYAPSVDAVTLTMCMFLFHTGFTMRNTLWRVPTEGEVIGVEARHERSAAFSAYMFNMRNEE